MLKLLFKLFGKGKTFKLLFNISPMYRSTGGRLIDVSNDLQRVMVKLPLNYKTKNYVGTLYGGKMYSVLDGIYMVQLINLLGHEYVVWDKSATIRFKRPGNKTLYAEFLISKEFLDEVKNEINQVNEKDFKLSVTLKDNGGNVYAEVDKVIYIASKAYYNVKRKSKSDSQNKLNKK